MKIQKWCQGVLIRIILLSIVAVSFFAQDLVAQPLTVTPASAPTGTVGLPYSATFTGTGGTAPYTLSITGVPAGLTAVGGTISGTPTTPGTYPISVRVTDSTPATPQSVTINPNIVVSAAPLTISPTSVPPATAGAPYSLTFSASGGTGPYTWSVSGLPSGLSATGPAINGTVSPTALGSFPLTVKVTDSATPTPASTIITPTLFVGAAPLTISTTSAPASTVGAPYTLSLVAIGGTGPYSWSISGALPDGLTRTGATISGTPTRQGVFSFIVQVTDSAPTPQTVSGSLSIQVNPPVLTVTSTSLPGGTVGVPYNQTLSATGGAGAYSWSITGNLPAGLSLSGATISGTPSSAGSASFVVHVADSGSPVQNAQQSLSIAIAPAPLVITTGSLPGATATIAYNQTLAAGGGTPPFAWSVASGSQLPTGLSLSGGGTISGTPTTPRNVSFTVQVTDSSTPTPQTNSKGLTLVVNPPPVVISTSSLSAAQVGVAYNQSLSATGGTGSYSWLVVAGNLPAGLSLSGSTISGTPTAAGTVNLTVQVTDAGTPPQTNEKAFSILVNPAPLVMNTASLPTGMVGVSYNQTLQASGGTIPYNWSIVSGTLPAGLSLNGGVISGTPASAGNVNLTILLTDSGTPTPQTVQRVMVLMINPGALGIGASTLPPATVGAPYSQTLMAIAGIAPYTWTIITGSLPSGLSLSGATIVGVPTAPATANFTIRITDSSLPAQTFQKAFTLMVVGQLTIITSSPLPVGTIGVAYSHTLVAAGGTPNYTWSVASGTLPPGLTLSATGTLSGQPSAPGTSSFTLHVSDASSPTQTTDKAFELSVGTAVSITTASLPAGVAGTAYSQTLSATGGTPPYHWSLGDGQLPPGITISDAGLMSGTPTTVGVFEVTIRVADTALPERTATKVFQSRIDPPAGQPLQITTQSLAAGIVGFAYSQQLEASGGAIPYAWSVTSGILPSGLVLTPAGVLQGTPNATGSATITIRVVDPAGVNATRAFPLTIGPPIGSLSSNGLPSAANPAQQVPFTLSLSGPYPAAISGSLTISFVPDAVAPSDDPAMQFATGGRTVTFSFPANSTTAVLPPQFVLMSGTVAGTITVTGRIQNGPSGIALGSVGIRSLAPQISNVVASRVSGGLRVQLTGYSPERRLTEIEFGFDVRLSTGVQRITVTKTAESEFRDWYQSPASSPFGSTFVLEQNFGVTGDSSTIEAVTLTMKNGQGSSTSARVPFQ